jgi:hypothetical protein
MSLPAGRMTVNEIYAYEMTIPDMFRDKMNIDEMTHCRKTNQDILINLNVP